MSPSSLAGKELPGSYTLSDVFEFETINKGGTQWKTVEKRAVSLAVWGVSPRKSLDRTSRWMLRTRVDRYHPVNHTATPPL